MSNYLYTRILEELARMKDTQNLLTELMMYFAGKESAANLSQGDAAFDIPDTPNLPANMDPDDFLDLLELQKTKQQPTPWEGLKARSAASNTAGGSEMPRLKKGSIMKRADGRWMGRYSRDGIRVHIYAKTKEEIILKMNQSIEEDLVRKSGSKKKVFTLGACVNSWFEEWQKGKSRSRPLSAKSIENVKFTLIRYVVDHRLSKLSLSKVTPDDIDVIMDDIPTKSMQARTFSYLAQVMQWATRKEYLKKNPMENVTKRARPQAKKKYIPNPKEWKQFLEWLKGRSIDCYYFGRFIADSGLRKGEALALTMEDIDLHKRWIHVTKSYSDSLKKVVNNPKTEAGVRKVPLFDDAFEVLREIGSVTGEIFTMVSKQNITHKFAELAIEYGLPSLPLHNLRHYFATQCYMNGVDKKTYSRWLGHANIDISVDTYSHITPEFERVEIAKMAKKGDF